MQIYYGPYIIKTHELDQKLSVQVTSALGDVSMSEEAHHPHGFPNGICFNLSGTKNKPEAKGLKKYAFGEYTFILGINNIGELSLFHSVRLVVGKKVIDGKDTLTLAFLKDPKSH
ncbi:MAG: hypothetical protein COA44_14820 [Arcobacter sp.]|nr:MAG: hypothetical protein COA44_14820 [Arcobacter sp.]